MFPFLPRHLRPGRERPVSLTSTDIQRFGFQRISLPSTLRHSSYISGSRAPSPSIKRKASAKLRPLGLVGRATLKVGLALLEKKEPVSCGGRVSGHVL